MGYKLNGVTTGGLPIYLIEPLLQKYDIPYMVETGSAACDSAVLASIFFRKIWTIELIEGRQKTEKAPDNIVFITGDSVEHLSKIVEETTKTTGYTLFYLDAHYSGDKPNETGYPECPLLKEIEIIAQNGYKTIIIIDDARLFLGQPPYPHNPTEWPSIKEIFILLNEKFPYHHITITDDYILAIPLHVRDVIDEEWRNRFHIRYPNEQDKLKTQVKDVYIALKKYIE